MGRTYAEGIVETDLPLEQQLEWHLRANFFPPIPATMIEPCIRAIKLYNEGNAVKMVGLPDGVGYKGLTVAPAIAIIEAHRLETWLDDTEYDYE